MISLKPSDSLGLFEDLHEDLKLSGEPQNGLLSISQNLLLYLLALLRDETPLLPALPLEKWEDFLTILNSHGIIPLLYWKIGRLPGELRPPTEIINRMRQIFLANRAACFRREVQLWEILEIFQKERVPVLVLKGPALGRMVYPELVTRPSNDIDLLAHPGSFIKARTLMEILGYQCLVKKFETVRGFYTHEEFVFRTKKRAMRRVDLHWNPDIFSGVGPKVAIEDLFKNSLKLESQGFSFETLNLLDTLIYLAVHLTMNHNQGMRLIWIYDIDLIANEIKESGEWEELQEKSLKRGAILALENSLKMAQVWCGLRIPHGFDNFSTWPNPGREDSAAWFHALHRHNSFASMFKVRWSVSSKPREQFKYLFNLLFPGRDYLQNSGPLPLFYIQRWGKWFLKYVLRK